MQDPASAMARELSSFLQYLEFQTESRAVVLQQRPVPYPFDRELLRPAGGATFVFAQDYSCLIANSVKVSRIRWSICLKFEL